MSETNSAGSPRVLVLNQAALPLGMAGGTRHVELFGRLRNWDAQLVAGNRSYLDQAPVESQGILRAVWVSPHTGSSVSRVGTWISYMISSFVRSMTGPKPDIVWGSSPQMGAAVVAVLVARLRRARFVLEVRDLWPHILVESGVIIENSMLHRLIRRLEEFLYNSAEQIVVLAEGTGREIADRGFGAEKIVFLPNGADIDSFVVEEAKPDLRDEFGFGGFVLIYAGAHGPANGLDLVLDAAADLDDTDSTAHFMLIGDGIEKPKLQARAAQAGLNNVTFMDPVPKSQIPRYYKAADAGLHCLDDVDLFKFGVSPNKLYDYMAAGLPVITNAGGDVAAMVEQAGSGVAVDPRQIASGVRQLEAADDELRTEWSRAGRSFMTAHRSRAQIAASLERLLDRVIQS